MSVVVIVIRSVQDEFPEGYDLPEQGAFLRRLVVACEKLQTGKPFDANDPIMCSIESFD